MIHTAWFLLHMNLCPHQNERIPPPSPVGEKAEQPQRKPRKPQRERAVRVAEDLASIQKLSPEDTDLIRDFAYNVNRDGYYRRLRYSDMKMLLLHRQVLERMVGRPLESHEIGDHINGDRKDNRRENLRIVTKQQNAEYRANLPFRGTTLLPHGKWQAFVHKKIDGKRMSFYCGSHNTRQEAADAAAKKRSELGFYGESPACPQGTQKRGGGR